MAALKDNVKLAIVQALACYDTPSQVAEFVKQEFGLTVPRQQVAMYDPTKAAGRNLSEKLRQVFEATREAFLTDVASVPIAQQAFRLRVLQRSLEKAEASKNIPLVAQLLEQAAKEIGGALTNRRELTGKDGRPIAVAQASITKEELAEAVRSVREEF
jgi:hypothetical protein